MALHNVGGRTFTGSVVATPPDAFSEVVAADFESDGDVDLVSKRSRPAPSRLWASDAQAAGTDGDGWLD